MANCANVLIVDDREENLLAMGAILNLPNIAVLKATSGEMAIELLLTHEIALTILDVQMPGMDGFETAELMRSNKRTRGIPIIFVTGISKDERFLFKGYEAGAVDYLCKPIQAKVLLSKVRFFVERYFQKLELLEKTRTLDSKVQELELLKSELENANQRLEHLSSRDALTNLYNRRAFDEKSAEEFHRSCRNERHLALLMVDIDFFKNYNDCYGHQQGDKCLVQVAHALAELVHRPGDLLARYGGEEFLILLPETDVAGARHMAERICATIHGLSVTHAESEIGDLLTVSVGAIATQPHEGFHVREMVQAADVALYQAKNQGRDCAIARELSL